MATACVWNGTGNIIIYINEGKDSSSATPLYLLVAASHSATSRHSTACSCVKVHVRAGCSPHHACRGCHSMVYNATLCCAACLFPFTIWCKIASSSSSSSRWDGSSNWDHKAQCYMACQWWSLLELSWGLSITYSQTATSLHLNVFGRCSITQ